MLILFLLINLFHHLVFPVNFVLLCLTKSISVGEILCLPFQHRLDCCYLFFVFRLYYGFRFFSVGTSLIIWNSVCCLLFAVVCFIDIDLCLLFLLIV
jgi:hypothetical protein